MNNTNEMFMEFDSKSENEGFARVVVAAFVSPLDPTMEELADIKTAVSEAVTNCIIHGYDSGEGKIKLKCKVENKTLTIQISDNGVGIEDIVKAMEPLYTTRPEMERSGMGFAFMEAFMDKVDVVSEVGQGTTVTMMKTINSVLNNKK